MDLKSYLTREDLSSNQFATRAGIATSIITRFLAKDRGLSAATAAQISAATNGEVSIQDLLFPEGLPPEARLASNQD
jgi:DNA-binding transcriptional regulator YdaS (Cro superfamily)